MKMKTLRRAIVALGSGLGVLIYVSPSAAQQNCTTIAECATLAVKNAARAEAAVGNMFVELQKLEKRLEAAETKLAAIRDLSLKIGSYPRRKSCGSAGNCILECDGGDLLVGGGCTIESSTDAIQNIEFGRTAITCTWQKTGDNSIQHTAFAYCQTPGSALTQ